VKKIIMIPKYNKKEVAMGNEEIGLFPVFEVPETEEEEDVAAISGRRSVLFDMESGDFVLDGAGRMIEADEQEAYVQWCVKAVTTARYACRAYPDEIGTELDLALEEDSREAVESGVEKEITECLMVNPLTEYVGDFEFTWDTGRLAVSFTVKKVDDEEFEIQDLDIGIGG